MALEWVGRVDLVGQVVMVAEWVGRVDLVGQAHSAGSVDSVVVLEEPASAAEAAEYRARSIPSGPLPNPRHPAQASPRDRRTNYATSDPSTVARPSRCLSYRQDNYRAQVSRWRKCADTCKYSPVRPASAFAPDRPDLRRLRA